MKKKNHHFTLSHIAAASLILMSAITASATPLPPANVPSGGDKGVASLKNDDVRVGDDAVTYLFFVKNSSNALVAYRDSELDKPATLTRLGNARKVMIGGKQVDVEITVVMTKTGTRTIDRYTPIGDSDDSEE